MFNDTGLSYSFHLGNDKNKTSKARQMAKSNKSNTTSFSNNAIQNIKHLGKANHHNLRKYDNNQSLIKTIKGSNDIVKDVKNLYYKEFEEARLEYNKKQTRSDRQIKDYFYQISNDNKHDLACEIIIELGDKEFWKNKTKKEKYKMVDVFKEQIEDLKNIVPSFKIANATIHFDESSPHLHIVGIAVKENCKTGMSKQVGKTTIFTKESLKMIQDRMRVYCINSFNKVYGLEEVLKKKKKGRNQDISSKDMEEFNQEKNKLKSNLENLKNEVEDLKETKETVTKELEDKKKYNHKVVLKDKAILYKENEKLKHELSFEKSLHYQYEQQYKSLKEKTDYLIEQIKKVLDKVPNFIKIIVERLFIYKDIDLKYFKQNYDLDEKAREEKERKRRLSLFRKGQKVNENIYESKVENEKSKEKDNSYSL